MSQEIQGIIRTVVAAGFAYLAGKGIIDAGMADGLATACVTIAVAIWSVRSKRA
jgi:hypothetical protein